MPTTPGSQPKMPAVRERNLVYMQFLVAVFLIVFGALLFVVYKWAGIYPPSQTSDNSAVSLATAIIGAGVAVLPAGAAGAASARILSGLPNIGGGPTATTGAATQDTANPGQYTLAGTIDGRGVATSYYFEYGPSTSYGQTTAVQAAPTNTAAVHVTAGPVQLNAGDHYRVVALNAGGTAYGTDSTV